MRVFAVLLMTGLMGCAGVPKIGTASNTQAKPSELSSDQLSPRSLKPGECGLFVWTADSQKRLVLFSDSKKEQAVWQKGGAETQLSITQKSGVVQFSQYPIQTLRSASGDVLNLRLRDAQRIDSGARYKGGVLSVTSGDEWERVIPVVALAGCQLDGNI